MMRAFQPRWGQRGLEGARDMATSKDTISFPTCPACGADASRALLSVNRITHCILTRPCHLQEDRQRVTRSMRCSLDQDEVRRPPSGSYLAC